MLKPRNASLTLRRLRSARTIRKLARLWVMGRMVAPQFVMVESAGGARSSVVRRRTGPTIEQDRRHFGAEHEQLAREPQEQEETDHGPDRAVQKRRARDEVGDEDPAREL